MSISTNAGTAMMVYEVRIRVTTALPQATTYLFCGQLLMNGNLQKLSKMLKFLGVHHGF
jgi:hypothetical protein